MSDKPFNEHAADLINGTIDLIEKVLIKHSAAVLNEMHDQIVARNARIAELEAERAVLVTKMVDRFLGWRLPDDFAPDCGISFKAEYNQQTPYPAKHEPIGTNLFSADQARKMFEHALTEPVAPGPKPIPRNPHDKEYG